MLKLSLKPGEYITLGDNIKIIFSGGSANNIHLLVDAPREINVARNSAGKDKKPSPYYREKGISKTAQREIAEILMREKRNQSHVARLLDGVEYGVFGDFVEYDAFSVLRFESEHFVEMPCDGLSLAVLIGCEPHRLGFLGSLLKLGYKRFLIGRDFVDRLKI